MYDYSICSIIVFRVCVCVCVCVCTCVRVRVLFPISIFLTYSRGLWKLCSSRLNSLLENQTNIGIYNNNK